MKLFIALLLFTSTLFSQNNAEISPKEIRKIETEFTKEYIENYEDEFGGNPWSIPFQGCSWYCGGRIDSIQSSTKCEYLDKHHINSYKIHDSDYGTAWINNDDDKFRFIEYLFNPESSDFTEIIIVNGNVKNDSLWNEYSRAKKIKMYINGKEFKTLKLEDIKYEQVFVFKRIGRKTKPKSKNKDKQWIIKLEVIDVYPGIKQNIALSEIYFGGVGHENE